jgi:hypothetical protein
MGGLPGEKEAVLEVIKIAERYGYGNMIGHLKRMWAMKLMGAGMSKELADSAADASGYHTDYLGIDSP